MSFRIVSRPRAQAWYKLAEEAGSWKLLPYEIAGNHVSETMNNRVPEGVETLNVFLGEAKDIEADEFLKPHKLPDGRKAVYAYHGSAIKQGWATFIVVNENSIQYLMDTHRQMGIYENLYRGGSHDNPHTMFVVEGRDVTLMKVPDGTIITTQDGKASIIRDGHSVFDQSIASVFAKSGRKPFNISPATLAPPNVLSQLDWDEDVANELLQGFELRSKALNRESYAAFLSALRFGDKRGDLAGQSVLGNISFANEILSTLDKPHGIDREVQGMIACYPAFVDKMAKSLSEDMYRTATTGALKGKYFKLLPIPVFLGEDEPVVVVQREAHAGNVAVTRQPASDRKSTLAATAKYDDRRAFASQIIQFRLDGFKGIASLRKLEGATMYLPDGSKRSVPRGVKLLLGAEDAKYPKEKAISCLTPWTQSVSIHITEWVRKQDTVMMTCGYVQTANGIEYHEELDNAKKMNGDFDGDGVSLWWLQEKPLLWDALHKNNQVDISVDKFSKSKTPLPEWSTLTEYRQLCSERIHHLLTLSMANYVGNVTNLMQRFFLYSAEQREELSQSFGMTGEELEAEFAFFLQLAVDCFKTYDQELIEKMDTFIKRTIKTFSGQRVPHGHVGKNKNDRVVGNGAMWFVNHIPEVKELSGLNGFIPQIMRRTLAKNDQGEYIRWFADLPNGWGVLPNQLYNKWVLRPNKELLKFAKDITQAYGRHFHGVAVGYEMVDQHFAKSQWRDEIERFSSEMLEQASERGFKPQELFDAMWWHYTCDHEQRGDQSLMIVMMPQCFIEMLKRLVKDWDGTFIHPHYQGKLEDQTDEYPLLNVSRLWVNYPDTPMIRELDGKVLRVRLECAEQLINKQHRVVSIIKPIDVTYRRFLKEIEGMEDAIGYTQTVYEGEMNAAFAWVPGKNSGGTMRVQFSK